MARKREDLHNVLEERPSSMSRELTAKASFERQGTLGVVERFLLDRYRRGAAQMTAIWRFLLDEPRSRPPETSGLRSMFCAPNAAPT